MNIIHLEGKIEGLRKMQTKERAEALKHRYTVWIDDYQKKLDKLTLQLEPKEFIKKLIMLNEL